MRLGHEFIGTVEETGPDVRTLAKGDRVLVSGVIGCGRCAACLARDPVVCRGGGSQVFGARLDLPGGQAEAVAVPHADPFCLKIPEGVTDEQAVLLTDILPTGYLGAQRADIRPGSTVAVIGLGPVGLLALRCAQLFSPARVFAVDTVASTAGTRRRRWGPSRSTRTPAAPSRRSSRRPTAGAPMRSSKPSAPIRRSTTR